MRLATSSPISPRGDERPVVHELEAIRLPVLSKRQWQVVASAYDAALAPRTDTPPWGSRFAALLRRLLGAAGPPPAPRPTDPALDTIRHFVSAARKDGLAPAAGSSELVALGFSLQEVEALALLAAIGAEAQPRSAVR